MPRATRWTGTPSSRAARAASRSTRRSARSAGQGIAEMVERCCDHASRFGELLGADPDVEILNDIVLNQVLVRFGDDDAITQATVRGVQEDGTCWLSGTQWQGRGRCGSPSRTGRRPWRTSSAAPPRSWQRPPRSRARCAETPALPPAGAGGRHRRRRRLVLLVPRSPDDGHAVRQRRSPPARPATARNGTGGRSRTPASIPSAAAARSSGSHSGRTSAISARRRLRRSAGDRRRGGPPTAPARRRRCGTPGGCRGPRRAIRGGSRPRRRPGHSAPNRLEPQTEQKAFTRPSSGLKTRISSSPASRRNPARGTRPCVPPNAPECFRHREQWQ